MQYLPRDCAVSKAGGWVAQGAFGSRRKSGSNLCYATTDKTSLMAAQSELGSTLA